MCEFGGLLAVWGMLHVLEILKEDVRMLVVYARVLDLEEGIMQQTL